LVVAGSNLVLTAPAMVFESAIAAKRIVAFPPPLKLPDLHLHLYWSARRDGEAKLSWLRAEVLALASPLR
jgi:hypothetical protein